MSSKKRSHKMEKLARIHDDEVLPVWTQPFGRMLLRGLQIPDGSQILDVACGTGFAALELLRRMGPRSRLIAIDGSSVMLDVARRKVEKLGIKGVFFRTESAEPRLSFASDVYDLVVCNLGLMEMQDSRRAVADFARVARTGGQVRCTMPLLGSFGELYDIYREVLIKHDKHDVLARLEEHLATYPTVKDCESWMEAAGLVNARVEVEEFSMLFKSSREFFFAPVIEYGPLPEWKAIAGPGQEMQDIFWYIKEAIDAYFGGRAFQITVVAGCLVGDKREADDDDVTGQLHRVDPPREYVSRSHSTESLDEGEPGSDGELGSDGDSELDRGDRDDDLDVDEDSDELGSGKTQDSGTSELELEELEELDPDGDQGRAAPGSRANDTAADGADDADKH